MISLIRSAFTPTINTLPVRSFSTLDPRQLDLIKNYLEHLRTNAPPYDTEKGFLARSCLSMAIQNLNDAESVLSAEKITSQALNITNKTCKPVPSGTTALTCFK